MTYLSYTKVVEISKNHDALHLTSELWNTIYNHPTRHLKVGCYTLIAGRLEETYLYPSGEGGTVEIKEDGRYFFICPFVNGQGAIELASDSWLVLDEAGKVSVYDGSSFKKNFSIVKED